MHMLCTYHFHCKLLSSNTAILLLMKNSPPLKRPRALQPIMHGITAKYRGYQCIVAHSPHIITKYKLTTLLRSISKFKAMHFADTSTSKSLQRPGLMSLWSIVFLSMKMTQSICWLLSAVQFPRAKGHFDQKYEQVYHCEHVKATSAIISLCKL